MHKLIIKSRYANLACGAQVLCYYHNSDECITAADQKLKCTTVDTDVTCDECKVSLTKG